VVRRLYGFWVYLIPVLKEYKLWFIRLSNWIAAPVGLVHHYPKPDWKDKNEMGEWKEKIGTNAMENMGASFIHLIAQIFSFKQMVAEG